jgi:hypothetical protein
VQPPVPQKKSPIGCHKQATGWGLIWSARAKAENLCHIFREAYSISRSKTTLFYANVRRSRT